MDAAPRLPLLRFAFKTSPEPAHFAQRLKQYITEVYQEDGESYRNELHQLEGLRAAAAHPTPDAAGLAALLRYFCQLRALQTRFPMSKGQPAAVQFTWKDVYANITATTADIKYEMAAVLYNIGALYSQLGADENRSTPDGLKSACTQFQTAAWVFQQLGTAHGQPPGVDISPEVARVLHQLSLAQAQECILEKSIGDARKPTTVGAVATQVLAFYRNAAAHLNTQYSSISPFEIMGTKHGNVVQRYIQFKSAYIGSVTALYHGMHAEEQQKMGERVAYYQLAVDRLEEARKLMKYIEPKDTTQEAITFTNDVVEGKRKAAKNENEFIYHEEVPEKELLTEIKPAPLVKELPINFNDPEVSGTDLFARLVPMGAHEAASLYSEQKASLLRRAVAAAEAKDQALAEFMSSLQLDLLDATDADDSIPQEVVDRCAAMNADSSIIQTLVESMNSLAEIISDVEHSLTDAKQMILAEFAEEKEYQATMGARPPSIVQTDLSREANKYAEAHSRTSESNQVLHKAMTLHLANLRLLASPLDVLREKIPSVSKIAGLDMATLAEMKKVTGAVRDMQKQRAELIQQLREEINNDDITPHLLTRTEHSEEIFKEQLEKHEPKMKLIELNLAAQENIINRLTTVYASYGESRRLLADVIRRREALINALITSYDTRSELLGKAQKGLEFYRKLSTNVAQLLPRLRATCQVQREERGTLLAKHGGKGNTSAAAAREKTVTAVSAAKPESSAPKLKDYLPYMKNRNSARTAAALPERLPSDQVYPETMYPTSARPAPVGSEANTDPTQIYTDGYAGPSQSTGQNVYTPQYNYGEVNNYSTQNMAGYQQYLNSQASTSYDYQQAEKSYTPQSMDSNSYATNYTPSQYPNQSTNMAQNFYSPYYTGSQDVNTMVTNSQNNQQYPTDPQTSASGNPGVYYMSQQGYPNQQTYNLSQQQYPASVAAPTSISAYNMQVPTGNTEGELSRNFSQMQISGAVTPGYPPEVSYSQTHFSAYYLQNVTPNIPTYSNAAQPTPTSMTQSQQQIDYTSLNYPYSVENTAATVPTYQGQHVTTARMPTSYDTSNPAVQYSQYIPNVSEPMPQISNNMSQVFSSANSYAESSTVPVHYANSNVSSVSNANVFPNDEKIISSAAISNLPVIDQPIKSHVTGHALASDNSLMQQAYAQNYPGEINSSAYSQSIEESQGYASRYQDQKQEINASNYPQSQSFQSHPGYYFNPNTGNYEYNYGYQSSNPVYNEGVGTPNIPIQQRTNIYTSAGSNEMIQSPSTKTEPPTFPVVENGEQNYYNTPYGYQSSMSANTASTPDVMSSQQANTNYGADTNQSTYMSSGHSRDSISTYSSQDRPKTATSPDNTDGAPPVTEVAKEEKSPEQSTMDLLSGLDFSVDQPPLMPEIKVPPISEHMIRKPVVQPKQEQLIHREEIQEQPLERPAKRDIFSDPGLMNKFTQEVKLLQKLVDSLNNKTQSGITVLENKWKMLHEAQAKENAGRSNSAAMEHSGSNAASDAVPYDDSRLKLKVNPEVYINASEYKQLVPWCIPLVISSLPEEREHGTFWTAVLEKKVACVVCLQSEMELQGKCYWPTAKGQSLELDELKVTLDEVVTTVHWTERRLTLTKRKTAHNVVHYQITVFPSKVVSGPLVLLADRVLARTYSGRLSNQLAGAWLQCARGAGRSALLALLVALVCQVRAGQAALCDTLELACAGLLSGRARALHEPRYLADAYRAALFYAQGVLCSGNTAFNGEAVSSASAPPPPPPAAIARSSKESFEEMRQAAGLKRGDMRDPLSFLDPLWTLKKK